MFARPRKHAEAPPRSLSTDFLYNRPLSWQSEHVTPFTDAFQHLKVKYSKETEELLKVLMEESKMTMTMRKQIDNNLRSGEPLPKPEPRRVNSFPDAYAINQNLVPFRRENTRSTHQEGVKEVSTRCNDRVDQAASVAGSIDKNKQQNSVQAGKNFSANNFIQPQCRPPKDAKEITPEEMIDELLDQINERAIWLAKMEKLGEGKKYREEICGQIAKHLFHIRGLEAKIALQKKGFRYVD